MSAGASRIYHDGTYLQKNPGWHEEDASYKGRDIIKLLARHHLQPGTVCEVGCGSGGVLEYLSRELSPSAAFTGYDVSEQALALCRPKASGKLRFVLASLPEQDVRYDLLLALDVIEHVPDYIGFLEALRSRAAHKIFRIPLNLSVQSVLFQSHPILQAREAFGHLHYFTTETALATLRDAGYGIIDLCHTFSPISAERLGRTRALLKSLKKACFSLYPAEVARLLDGFSLMVLAE